jgi:hypothetical protein
MRPKPDPRLSKCETCFPDHASLKTNLAVRSQQRCTPLRRHEINGLPSTSEAVIFSSITAVHHYQLHPSFNALAPAPNRSAPDPAEDEADEVASRAEHRRRAPAHPASAMFARLLQKI